MATEPDQTKWVGIRPTPDCNDIPTTTRKLLPAISDLQAIKAPLYHMAIGANKDCSVVYYQIGAVVAAGELYVITEIAGINFDSMCDMIFYTRGSAATRRLCGYYSVEPDIIMSWHGQIVLKAVDYVMIGFELGGATDDVRITTHGHIIGVY